MTEQVSVDLLLEEYKKIVEKNLKNIAENRSKIIDDYMKFYLAVNAPNLTLEEFTKNYRLIVAEEILVSKAVIYYQMLPHNKMIIDYEEYERLKRLDKNVNKITLSYKSMLELNKITNSMSESEIQDIQRNIELLERLYDETTD